MMSATDASKFHLSACEKGLIFTKNFQPLNSEETQTGFDGFPAGQQEDADDLLKPDPNFSYPSERRKPKNNPVTVTSKSTSKCKNCFMFQFGKPHP